MSVLYEKRSTLPVFTWTDLFSYKTEYYMFMFIEPHRVWLITVFLLTLIQWLEIVC